MAALATSNITSPNNTNLTEGHTNGTLHGSDHTIGPTPILFIFAACTVGALVRTVMKKVRLPYTVILLVLGGLLGLLSSNVPQVAQYTVIASMDPHIILHVFLPVLVFESAFAMETHTFIRSFGQILILAVPGLAMATFLTALFGMYMFSYNWGWATAILFGAIVSATDPVAVVSLLKELGASKTLSILMEGESLLNDGAAIIIFNVFLQMAKGQAMGGLDIFVYFVKVLIGGPLFGFFMARLTVLWLVNIFNDALAEITITLAATYLTFYIGEETGISGVLATVVLGVTLSAERTSISPEVEVFLHRFWEMLAYLANTLIFILVGVVITEKAIANTNTNDWFLLVALYSAAFVIRAVMIMLFSPILRRIGYGISWRTSTVMTWGGLRGAVGLTLALIVSQDPDLDPNVQSKILLHSSGLVVMTLLINATSIGPLLKILGMSEVSMPKRLAMASAVRQLQDVADTSMRMYKSDRFLADADWDVVGKYSDISDPYHTLDEEAELDQLTNMQRTSKCPKCSTAVTNEPTIKEYSDMQCEARLRLLKAEKTSYWKQFEHGMLSREAVRRLVEYVDIASDVPEFINSDEIKKNWKVGGIYAYMKRKLEHWRQSQKLDESVAPPPRNSCLYGCYVVTMHSAFDIFLYVVIFLNCIVTIYQVVEESIQCQWTFIQRYGNLFDYFNYCFLVIYTIEAFMKILALRLAYFKSKWNVFDFIILILSVGDLIVDFVLFQGTVDEECDAANPLTFVNFNVVKIAKMVRLLRLLRSLRLIKGLIPQFIDVVNHQINKKLRLGYDVGKGFITGEEDVHSFLDIMIDNSKIANELKDHVIHGRLHVMKELGLLQKLHPGIAVSIKTQQATRRILNNLRDKTMSLKGEGVLDEPEALKLEMMVEVRMKKLIKIPATIQAPPPEKIIGNLSWVTGDKQLLTYITENANLVTFAEDEVLNVDSDPRGGIYIIISGLVKVDRFVEDNSHRDQRELKGVDLDKWTIGTSERGTIEKFSDYLSTGNMLGELSLLTGKPSNTNITCDTSTLMYHIPYEAIQGALELFIDAPSLENRLWRVAAIRIAAAVLRRQIHYAGIPHDDLQMTIEKCLLYLKTWEVPDGGRFLSNFTFDINTVYMADVVLIHGYAKNPDTNDMFVGPAYIPSRVEKLHLIPGKTEKHVILILPRDINIRMERHSTENSKTLLKQNSSAEDLCDEASHHDDLCLQHAVESRSALSSKISDTKMVKGTSLATRVSNTLIGSGSQVRHRSSNVNLQGVHVDASKPRNKTSNNDKINRVTPAYTNPLNAVSTKVHPTPLPDIINPRPASSGKTHSKLLPAIRFNTPGSRQLPEVESPEPIFASKHISDL